MKYLSLTTATITSLLCTIDTLSYILTTPITTSTFSKPSKSKYHHPISIPTYPKPPFHQLRATPIPETSSSSSSSPPNNNNKKQIVIIGGGWAGFSAAESLSSCPNVQILLLDASPRGKGGLAGGWRTPSGRPVEAGIHGFWREYRNTFKAIERIGLDLDEVLTPYTPSVLVSKSGKVAVAPVLAEEDEEKDGNCGLENVPFPSSPDDILETISKLLPPPLDLALTSEFSPTSPLTIADRISALGLLGAWADFRQEDTQSWNRYDTISADELFLTRAGISKTLYDELVAPLLHVLPMTPGYDCSAAAALSCFHVFALQSKGAFDVRWCRGPISETIFDPWVERLVQKGNVEVRGGAKVTGVERMGSTVQLQLNGEEMMTCDAVVFAVGATAMKRLTKTSVLLSEMESTREFDKLRGVTCVAVRLFLRPRGRTSGLKGGRYDTTDAREDIARSMEDSPVVVCGPAIGDIPLLEETGFCVYDLQRMQDEFASDRSAAVLEVDFFRADAIADLETDAEVAELALKAVSAALDVEPIDSSDIVDLAVVRARNAVSHFAVDSASCSPPVKLGEHVYVCGDWIDRKGHASWSTEKAVVTGRQAARAVADDFGLVGCETEVMEVVPDTVQLQTLRRVAGVLRQVAPPPGQGIPPSPWVFIKDALSGGSS